MERPPQQTPPLSPNITALVPVGVSPQTTLAPEITEAIETQEVPEEDELNLEDFVYSYPPITNASFQTLITSKQEFRELASWMREPRPLKGELYRHQTLIRRFMLAYDDALIFHRTGTGKSCTVFGTTEQFKIALIDAIADFINIYLIPQRTNIKRIYFLTKSTTLIDELKYQLACKCTNGQYLTDKVLNSTTTRARKINLTNQINKFYTISTYGTFASSLIEKNYSDEQLQDLYSDSMFIVDEVQNITVQPLDLVAQEEIDESEPEEARIEAREELAESAKEKREKEQTYRLLHRLFHTLKRRKVMLLSATPMTNDVREIGSVMDLILPLNMQMGTSFPYTTATLDNVRTRFQGRISYVRELDTGAVPTFQGQKLNATLPLPGNPSAQSILFASQMSKFQESVYNTYRSQATQGGRFHIRERQACNFVFPDKSVGQVGFNRYVRPRVQKPGSAGQREEDYVARENFIPYLTDLNRLRVLSCKFASVINNLNTQPGNSFVFFNFLTGAGVFLFSVCLKAQGWTQFLSDGSVFQPTAAAAAGVTAPTPAAPKIPAAAKSPATPKTPAAPKSPAAPKTPAAPGSSQRNYCNTSSDSGVAERSLLIEKSPPGQPRFAILSSRTPVPRRDAILELFNSYENRHGEYLKAVIGSPITQIGINLANVLNVHVIGPNWNQSATYQAISRAIRATSHEALIQELRLQLSQARKDPNLAQVPVKIYQHAGIASGGTSIDTQMYQLSEIKDIEIRRMERLMKQMAFDCQIHYRRNVRLIDQAPGYQIVDGVVQGATTDEDGSPACDYQECLYPCANPPPDEVDVSSYEVLYLSDLLNVISAAIRNIFRVNPLLTYDQLYAIVANDRQVAAYLRQKGIRLRNRYVDLAVERFIRNRTQILDRYGFITYLREQGSELFVQRDYPLDSTDKVPQTASISTYISNLNGVLHLPIDSYLQVLSKPTADLIERELRELPLNTQEEVDEFIDRLSDLPRDRQQQLLETAIAEGLVSGDPSPFDIAILDAFEGMWYRVKEPTSALAESNRRLAERDTARRGRKAGAETPVDIRGIDVIEEGPIVYLHTLANVETRQTRHGQSATLDRVRGPIRILTPESDSGWRFTGLAETPIYAEVIFLRRQQERGPEPEAALTGIIIRSSDSFLIVDNLTTGALRTRTGRVCAYYPMHQKIYFLRWFGLQPPRAPPVDNLTETQLKNRLLQLSVPENIVNGLDLEGLQFYYRWLESGVTGPQICNILRNHMIENNLIRYA